ncbi:MAG: flagellar basal body rod protein FlgB [Alphaproteobacteria bacterium]|nr:MAG: flagellar basal body rod protein FlgB [Alphaproteobacteria bacterium]
MTAIYLFNVVSRHNQWLAVRQSTIASNVANANTPGYKALDVDPFEKVLESTRLAMQATRLGHMIDGGAKAAAIEARKSEPWETTHSGNSVSLEQELINAGDVNRAYRLNTGIAKAFHRMLLASAKA